jgi:hypothetical protein
MDVAEFSNSQKLQQILVAQINDSPHRRITFAEYMELVLYRGGKHWGKGRFFYFCFPG